MRNLAIQFQKLFKYKQQQITAVVAILGLTLIPSDTIGQKLDSLRSLLKQHTGVERCNLLYQIAYEYVDTDNELGLYYSTQSLKLARQIGDSTAIVKAGRLKSSAFRRLNRTDSAIIQALEVLPIAKRNGIRDEIQQILNGLANAYTTKGFYDKALETYFYYLSIMNLPNDNLKHSIALQNIGLVYFKLEDFEKALKFYIKSLEIKKRIKSNLYIDILLINISLCYVNTNRFSLAQNFIDEVKSYCKGNCSEYLEMAMNHVSGMIAYGLKDFGLAEKYFFKGYFLAKKLNNQPYIIDNLNSLFRMFIERKRFDSALQLVQYGEEIIKKNDITYNPGLIQLYFFLAEVYNHALNYKMVTYYQKKYMLLKNSIYNEKLTRNLMKLEADYLERENKAKIKSQSEILALNRQIIYKQKIANVFIGVIALLLVIVAVVLVKANRAKKFANKMLENKVVDRTKELETNRTELQRSLNERDAQARKIALVVNNSLATISGLCLLGRRDEDPINRTTYLEKIGLTSEELLNMIRQIGVNKFS